MVHEYVRDPAELSAALNAGHGYVCTLVGAADAIQAFVAARFPRTL